MHDAVFYMVLFGDLSIIVVLAVFAGVFFRLQREDVEEKTGKTYPPTTRR